MKKILLTFMMFLLSGTFCFPEEDTRSASKTLIYEQSASYIRTSNRLEDAAALYEKYAPVPRIAIYDFVFAADLKEFKKLNACGVLMISAQCRDEKELPLKDVYLKRNGNIYRLTLLCSKKIENTGNISGRVFGKNRADYFYLIPYSYTQKQGEICVDWGAGQNGFSLVKLPAELELEYAGSASKALLSGKIPKDAAVFVAFLKREFSLGNEDTTRALASLGIKIKPKPTPTPFIE